MTRFSKSEKAQVMQTVTSWMEEGLRKGRQQGRQQGQLRIVLRLLARRFGRLPGAAETQVRRLSSAQLDELPEALLDFQVPTDLV